MREPDDELLERLSNMIEVPFTDALQHKIMRAAMQQQLARKKKRRFDWRGLTAGLGGVSAATVMIWGAWNYGGSVKSLAALKPNASSVDMSSTVLGDHMLGLQLAPISVQYLGNVGNEVHATLVNVGTQALKEQNYVGVLSFQPSSDPNLLRATDWIMFVDPPHMTLEPGDTVNWSFHPIGAPVDATKNLKETPKLVFFKQEMAILTKADVKWGLAPLAITQSPKVDNVHILQSKTGQSFQVHEAVQNTSGSSVSLDNCLAIIWFSKNPSDNWTAPDAVRFMATIAVPKGTSPLIQPNEQVQITSHLIGGLTPDFENLNVHVEFIHR